MKIFVLTSSHLMNLLPLMRFSLMTTGLSLTKCTPGLAPAMLSNSVLQQLSVLHTSPSASAAGRHHFMAGDASRLIESQVRSIAHCIYGHG